MTISADRLMELPNWSTRSSSAASMLNPALISLCVAAAAIRFEDEAGERMPWELSFLVPPMALHRDTREMLPNRVDSHMPRWVERNPVLHAGLSARAQSMSPFVREGLRFGIRAEALKLHDDATVSGRILGKVNRDADAELTAIIRASSFLGRWFGHIGDQATVYGVLGVTP
ncbi:three component ABC system middle component [Agromyces sp. NPDC055520]